MGSNANEKPHAVCIPYPAQGHINPILKLAKLLYCKGFHITFVNTEYNHRRLIRSRGVESVAGLPDFRFEAIPDGLPTTDADSTQHIPSLCDYTTKTCLAPFHQLLNKLNDTPSSGVPPVTCIVSDGIMSFAVDAAEEFGLPVVLFWTTSACGFLAYAHYKILKERGFTPRKDESYLTNGYLDTVIDGILGMDNIRLKDFPSFIRSTDMNDIMTNFFIAETARASRATAIILNTFDTLENKVVRALSTLFPPIYTIGPLHKMVNRHVTDEGLTPIESNLWKEDPGCLDWLDKKEAGSVLYVNFGSITVMTADQLTEFAWRLANSGKDFLWIIRPDVVVGDSAILPAEFMTGTKSRGKLARWCLQEDVLSHPSIAGFLTHSGWNSTIESITSGVPMICWPFFAEQQTNCWFSQTEWGIGMEIDSDVKREKVEELVRELMEGEKGKEMKMKAMDWKKKAEEAIGTSGSSFVNLENLVKDVLLQQGLVWVRGHRKGIGIN